MGMSTLGAMNPSPPRLVTLTPAPSWDITYSLNTLEPGVVHRAQDTTREFAGKGVNVSKALALAGIVAPAVVPLSHSDQASVSVDGAVVPVGIEGQLRTNVTVVETGGRTTKINQAASPLSAVEWSALAKKTAELGLLAEESWVLVSGTIPTSGEALESRLVELIDTLGPTHRVAVDTSGEALNALARSGRVDLIKPNVSELSGCVGRALLTLGDVVDAAKEVLAWGVSTVLVSLGEQGFLGVQADEVVWAESERVTVVNTIGAGDASVAGFFHAVLSGRYSLADSVASAAAWGALKVTQPGSQLETLEHLPRVAVHADIDADQPVSSD
jgi:1-phosphofructokinase